MIKRRKVSKVVCLFGFAVIMLTLFIGCGGSGGSQSSSSSSSIPSYVKVEILSQYNLSSDEISKIKGRKTQSAGGVEGWEGTMVLKANGSTLNWAVNVDR